MTDTVAFVNDPEFLRSSFDFGLTVDDGVRELVDNALDARATDITIITKTTENALHIIVQDNGVGIPNTIEEDGVPYEGIPYVMSFGGAKNFMKRSKGEIGKFGIGLSATITCLTREHGRASVWSKNETNAQGRQVQYRFTDVVANDCHLPNEIERMSPTLSSDPTGTVIELVLDDSAHMRPGAIQTRFLKFLGRNYRNAINGGVSITVIAMTAKGSPSAKRVRLRDPLSLMEGSMEVDDIGMAKAYNVPDLVMHDIIDPETDEPALISFRLSLMNSIAVRRKLGLQLTGATGQGFAKGDDNLLKKYGIGYNGQGFNLLREGRELAANASLNLYAKHGNYNYMHGDINFPSVLDGYFGVQSNKSRTGMNSKMKFSLKQHLKPFIFQALQDSQEQQKKGAKLAKELPTEPLAETIAKRLKPVLPQPRLNKDEIDEAEQMRKALSAALKAEVMDEMSPLLAILEKAIEGNENPLQCEQDELERDMLLEHIAEHISRIEARFKVSSPTRLFYKSLHSNDLYSMEDRGDEAHITVNTDTVFYTDVYAAIEKVPHMQVLLDMMLNTLGYAEFMAIKHGDDMKALFWERARAEVSLHANTFVRAMPASQSTEGGEV
jgi:hypothetical protein